VQPTFWKRRNTSPCPFHWLQAWEIDGVLPLNQVYGFHLYLRWDTDL
jgi:hypothetical protein